jgi:long-chain acyl-CoA synthetase
MERMWMAATGAAPIAKSTLEFFLSLDIPIYEVYGMSETTGPATLSSPVGFKTGSVGRALPGTEIKLAADGEILMRGPHIFSGYLKDPGATAEALDADGFLHSGDVGEFDEQGYLRITDRKKDLFKTSGGKYVAPQAIEGRFKTICPYASQFVVHGNLRNFVSALVTLDPDAIQGWASANGLGGKPYAEIVTSDAARAMVQGYVDELNAGLNRWETIKKFTILDRDLTVESGEMTPSLKLKRKHVETQYSDLLDKMYE